MTAMIHSLHNPRIKQAIRLRDRRGRTQQSRIIIDGWRETCRALEGNVTPLELFVCETLLDATQWHALLALAAARRVELTRVTPEVFEKLAFGDRGEGVVLVATLPDTSLEQIPFSPQTVIGVLEHVEKPGNLGAIVRTADAAGISAVVVADPCTDLFNPNAIRASLGALFRVPVAAASALDVRRWLEAHGAHVFAARVDATVRYTEVDFRRPCAIVLGSESHGLTEVWQGAEVQAVALPMCGIVDSLNVSVTAAVLFYEVLRQRGL
jgi:RNA methyltransferase, TrmH family